MGSIEPCRIHFNTVLIGLFFFAPKPASESKNGCRVAHHSPDVTVYAGINLSCYKTYSGHSEQNKLYIQVGYIMSNKCSLFGNKLSFFPNLSLVSRISVEKCYCTSLRLLLTFHLVFLVIEAFSLFLTRFLMLDTLCSAS